MLPPPTDTIAQLPVVRVGDPAPQTGDYVVFYPAAAKVPVNLRTSGSLFKNDQTVRAQVALAKDLYVYKYWASHDGKSWTHSHTLLDVDFGGGFDLSGLQANIKLDAK